MVRAVPRLGRSPASRLILSVLLSFSLAIIPVNWANAQVFQAKSCHYDDVSSAVTMAPPGSHVVVPSGRCDWQDHSLKLKKPLTLLADEPGKTIILRTLPNNQSLIRWVCKGSKGVRVSGFIFKGLKDPQQQDRGVSLEKGCQQFRIDHNQFIGFGNAGLEISNFSGRDSHNPMGLIDKNEFHDNFRHQSGYGVGIYFNGAYHPEASFGSNLAVFLEDNVFSGNKHAVASNHSAVYVFRYNRVLNNRPKYSAIDTHGVTKKNTYGTRLVEIYSNTISQNGFRKGYAGIGLRGGDAMIYSNEIDGYHYPILVTMEDGQHCKEMEVKPVGSPDEVHIWEQSSSAVYLGRDNRCRHLFSDLNIVYQKPDSYNAFPYPHPLRLENRTQIKQY